MDKNVFTDCFESVISKGANVYLVLLDRQMINKCDAL